MTDTYNIQTSILLNIILCSTSEYIGLRKNRGETFKTINLTQIWVTYIHYYDNEFVDGKTRKNVLEQKCAINTT